MKWEPEMSTRFNADELAQFIIMASQADPDDYPDYESKAAIYKAKAHVIDNGSDLLYCPPYRVYR
jgi:hypothetical protein